ncbi:MAG: protein-glutamate O-methyltransferase CheR [Leptospiraceae bacterium]|nr:protein-glutamate O-methyltransferase CheR [Leptospiraceae bacterium]
MNQFSEIPDLTQAQFQRFARLIHDKAHIHLKDHKITLLSNRLRKRLRALEFSSYDQYFDFISDEKTAVQEMVHFLEAVTTNESYFWRTTQNFDALKKHVLPELLKRFPGEKLNFWSAGCSTGEEPYNLAMELIESMKAYGLFEWSIAGSDISNRVVEFAREGIYTGRKIERVPEGILRRYFRKIEGKDAYQVRSDIRDKIQFSVENLFEARHAGMHCIFCRNVMIYFNREDQEKLVNRFHEMLKGGGYLFIGHAESLQMLNTPFLTKPTPEGVLYQKSG